MRLSQLSHPNELHGLAISELEDVACQIRERHLQVVSTSGGHLGPGLGVVELTIALYQTLDLDVDKVIWDVGHQAYPHKICLLYTSPSPRDKRQSRMPSSA